MQHISDFIELIKTKVSEPNSDRQKQLDELADVIAEDLKTRGQSTVKFICTHNSRRSQAAEFLLDVLARHYNLAIVALSAGTEATRFNQSMISALNFYGFEFIEYGLARNPLVIYSMEGQDLYYYSKAYTDKFMSDDREIIVTVCNDAAENCPIIPGTYKRLHLGYKDPKESDNTAHEAETYQAKVLEIGTEMNYLCNKLLSYT